MAYSPPSSTSLLLALGLLCLLSQLYATSAVHHEVGDMNGKWGVESYFQAGDSLSFSDHAYTSTEVHRVTREEYKACKAAKPMETYYKKAAGAGSRENVVAILGEATTYYFISGDSKLCMKGRKLMVVVQRQLAAAPATAPASPIAASPTPTRVSAPPAAAPTPTTTASAPPTSVPPPAAAAPPTAATPAAGAPTAETPSIASLPALSPMAAPGSSPPPSPPPSGPSSSPPALPPAGSTAAAIIISSSCALIALCTSLLLLA